MKKHLTILFLLFVSIGFAQNERRLALVVGNSEYLGKGNSLANPAHDAEDVSAKLKTLGFDVDTLIDGSLLQMDDAIDALGRKAKDYDVALFYYSGHGMQSKGDNYLVPVDAELRSEADIKYKCTAVNHLIAKLEESGCPMKIIVLDACRNNPFEMSWYKGIGAKGFSQVTAPKGTLIAYATAPGRTAEDGIGRNSPYTSAFLESLDIPNLSLSDFFDNVGTLVLEKTNDEQEPWYSKSAFKNPRFYFNTKATPAPSVAQATTSTTLIQPMSQKPSTTQPQPETVSAPAVTSTQSSPAPPTDSKSESLTFTVNGISFVMKKVEGGTFWMGAQSTDPNGRNYDKDAESNEGPVHCVTLDSYFMGETEVTQALWEAVMGTTIRQQRDKALTSWPLRGEGELYPMYYVDWNDCQTFIHALNKITGKNFRLPTEAEWEHAANNNKYTFSGSNTIDEVAWWQQSEASNKQGTRQVKEKMPNEFGLFDMTGNVMEWCSDIYGRYSSTPQINPQGKMDGLCHVLRGGSWCSSEKYCRVSDRNYLSPYYRRGYIGFRLALSE